LGLPIGAFVNIERDELDKISIKQKGSIMTAGPMSNIILAGVSLFLMFLITSSLTTNEPVNPNIFGVSVTSISPNSLAESLGLTKGSTIQQIQNNEIKTPSDLNENLGSNLGKTVSITWLNENGEKVVKQITLPKEREAGKGILGVTITEVSDPKKVLDNYNSLFVSNPLALLAPPTMAQGFIPFSVMMQEKYTSPVFGSYFPIPANLFFWLWFINFNVAIFNAFPIGPLDGGQLYNTIIDKKTEKRKGILRHSSKILTYGMIVIVALAFVVPWLMR
jgi:membrane-associated protease RseP (regulator of RpoE activity)